MRLLESCFLAVFARSVATRQSRCCVVKTRLLPKLPVSLRLHPEPARPSGGSQRRHVLAGFATKLKVGFALRNKYFINHSAYEILPV
jgi:predicted ABC-type transport system involved in lysophospholipase L1 biosynthesis ATPase subunit